MNRVVAPLIALLTAAHVTAAEKPNILFILTFALLLASLHAAEPKLNVLLILSDDHSYPHVGCYGNKKKFVVEDKARAPRDTGVSSNLQLFNLADDLAEILRKARETGRTR